MKRHLALLCAGSLAVWVVGAALSCILWPEYLQANLLCSLLALVLCLIPTGATFVWASWGYKQSPEQQLTAALGGTGIRMFFVLGVGLFLSLSVAFVRSHIVFFWGWVLVLYLCTLGLEMVILVRSQSTAGNSSPEQSTK